MSGTELYVYYRVARSDEAAAHAQVHLLMQQLAHAWPGLQARLLRRSAAHDAGRGAADPAGPSTWMEVYRHAHGLTAAQLASIRRAAADTPSQRIGTRHEETFEPFTDPAALAAADTRR